LATMEYSIYIDDWAKMIGKHFDIGAQGLTAIKAVPILGVVNTDEENSRASHANLETRR